MGLDMYAFGVDSHVLGDKQVDFTIPEDVQTIELAYWRKFHQLHGWMEDLFREKGGEGDFNCQTVRLMPEDLDRLSKDAEQGLPGRQGFFFGNGVWDETDAEEVQNFVLKAREMLAHGHAVYYDSWW